MKDIISIGRVTLLHPRVRDLFSKFINECEDKTGLTFRIVQGLRTFAEQDAIYAQGRTAPGKIVTNSRAGSSYHNYGLAVDMVPIANNNMDWKYKFSDLFMIAKSYGITWGGTFTNIKDLDHYEVKFGYNWRVLLDKYNRKDFIPGTEYVNI